MPSTFIYIALGILVFLVMLYFPPRSTTGLSVLQTVQTGTGSSGIGTVGVGYY